MQTAGIIAEFNPFHNGHAFLCTRLRQQGITHIVAVMGGNFTQRGEPACLLKSARCKASLSCGIDLVIELPVPWAVAGAETFASGAACLLNSLGCVSVLGFGSESGDLKGISRCAQRTLEADGGHELHDLMKKGLCFPKAREIALSQTDPGADLEILRNPNDTLAVEYLKALKKLKSPMRPLAVKRTGVAHDAAESAGNYACASFIRSLFSSGKFSDALRFVPPPAAQIYRGEFSAGRAPVEKSSVETAMLARIRGLSAQDFLNLPDVSEGLENRMERAVNTATSIEEIAFMVKSKRYTLSRIRRILACAFLGINRDCTIQPPPYARILGMNQRGMEILRQAKKRACISLVSRYADIRNLDERAGDIFRLECRASDLYGLFLPVRQPCAAEQTSGPIIA